MNSLINRGNYKVKLLVVSLIVFYFIFILNYYTPLIADDYSYSFIFNTNTRIDSIKDIFISQFKHYFEWGGRSVAHTFGQLSLFIGKSFFNLSNSIMYLLLIYLLCKNSIGVKKINISLFITMSLLVFLFTPVFGQTALWLIGSSNYLWCMVLILGNLLPYRIYLDGQRTLMNKEIQIFYTVLLGFFSGWTNENTSGAMILILMGFIVSYKIKNYKIPIWSYFGVSATTLGFLSMIIAPGNYVRANQFIDNRHFLIVILSRVYSLTSQIYHYLTPIFIIFIILFLIYILFKRKEESVFLVSFLYAFCSIAAIYALAISPTAPLRSFFGPTCFMYIAIGSIFYSLYQISYKLKIIIRSFIIILSVYAYFVYSMALIDIKETYKESVLREEIILEEKENGNFNISLEPIITNKSHNPLYGLSDIQSDTNHWINRAISKYYGVKTIQLK